MGPNNSNTNRTTVDRYRSTRPSPTTYDEASGRTKVAPPTPGSTAGRPMASDAGRSRTGASISRYRPRDVTAASPTRGKPTADAKPRGPATAAPRPDAAARPATTTIRPAPKAPTGSAPRPTTTPTIAARPAVVPNLNSGALAPRLSPRRAAPRLGGYARVTARVGRLGASGFLGSCYSWGGGYNSYNCGPIWNGFWGCNSYASSWWQPWHNCWSIGFGWGNWGFNTLACGFGALTPYAAFQTSWWNRCYNSCYWNSWSSPTYVGSNYWWYPQSTYCPIYLSVPNSVVVYDGDQLAYAGEAEAAPAAPQPQPSVVARARDAEQRDPGAASPAPTSLAEKYVELGDFYFRSGRYEDAAEAYAKARYNAPDDASVHFVLADASFANGDYHYAAFLIAEAVRIDPAIVTAEVDKRNFYGDPLDFTRQLSALEKHCSEHPYDAWAQLVLAYNLRFSAQPMRALAAFRRVLELDRDNQAALAFVADLESPARASAPAAGDGRTELPKSDR